METLSPIGWALRPFKKYANFAGRAPRAELWWFTVFVMIFYIVLMVMLGLSAKGRAAANPVVGLATGTFGIGMMIISLIWLALFIPSLAVQIRRLHDINRSGWWLGGFWLLYAAYMVLVIGSVGFAGTTPGTPPSMAGLAGAGIVGLAFFVYSIVLIVFWCKRGTAGPNRFGEDPYGANVEQVFA